MINPFYDYISPDQGYYTQQPATVDQVNNIWLFVQKMRRELSRTILEFNKYPDRQDELTQNVQSITDQLKLVQQQLEKLKGVDEKAAEAINNLKSDLKKALEEQNKAVTERLKDVKIITPENGSVLPVKKITGDGVEHTRQIAFTSTEDEAAITTNIAGSEDVVSINQIVPGLLHENLAPRFSSEVVKNGFAAKIDDEKILEIAAESQDSDLVEAHIDNVSEGEYRLTVSSDGVESEITRIDGNVHDLESEAVSVSGLEKSEKIDAQGVYRGISIKLKSVDETKSTFIKALFQSSDNDLLTPTVGYDWLNDIYIVTLNVADQLALSYPIHDVSKTIINGATIETSEVRYSYDKWDREIKASAPFDTKKITFTTTPDDKHPTYFEVDQAGNVTINTTSIENKIEKNATTVTTRMDTLQARLVELEEKVRRLETRAVNQITSSNIRIEPRQGDKLAFILENYYANGKHEEKQAIINFTSQDGALVFHTRDQGITDQAEIFINMNNGWLEKQGLSSTTNA